MVSHTELRRTAVLLLLAVLGAPAPRQSHAMEEESLPQIGAAPEFTLTNQDGKRLSLSDLRGKVVAVTFIFTTCTAGCALLTAKMVSLQHRLGMDFGSKVFFISITVDPDRDSPTALKRYAKSYGAEPAGWAFLTGRGDEIREVAHRYAVYYEKRPSGNVDHTFLTSLVDQRGTLRVQYMGVRFDADELLRDLRSLVREGRQP
jgi:protein SCO1/2